MSVTAFLTDSTLCIGCKACEVACKEWNGLDEDGLDWSGFSYDNTGAVGASTWRHVKFVEQQPVPGFGGNAGEQASWTFSSDVCKHCEQAGCLEACPTGSIVRTEFGGVFIQPDVCNGCGYCVTACPFGVVERNQKDGRAFKCTFCYDRQKVGLQPACAKACPTESIKFGEIEDLRREAQVRVDEIHREAERRGQLQVVTPRPSGAPFPQASPETGYYGIPLLKEPPWTWEIPLYFFVGGAAGAAAVIGAIADYTGADR